MKSIFKTQVSQVKNQRKQQQLAKLNSDMSGKGCFIFENNTAGDLHLPRATKQGKKIVRRGEQFEGDDYYFQLVKANMLKFVKEIKMEECLLTEQPPTVTHQGTVEYVLQNNAAKINEQQTKEQKPEDAILLTETPIDGIKILS